MVDRLKAAGTGLDRVLGFKVVDADRPPPFPDAAFHALLCNDAINNLRDRAAVLAEWRRVLRAGGRCLYTDPVVVTGPLSADEIARRSSIGHFVFTPPGVNESLLAEAGFDVWDVEDVTPAVAATSAGWRAARAGRRDRLEPREGEETIQGNQSFLHVVHTLAFERRLSRFAFLADRQT